MIGKPIFILIFFVGFALSFPTFLTHHGRRLNTVAVPSRQFQKRMNPITIRRAQRDDDDISNAEPDIEVSRKVYDISQHTEEELMYIAKILDSLPDLTPLESLGASMHDNRERLRSALAKLDISLDDDAEIVDDEWTKEAQRLIDIVENLELNHVVRAEALRSLSFHVLKGLEEVQQQFESLPDLSPLAQLGTDMEADSKRLKAAMDRLKSS